MIVSRIINGVEIDIDVSKADELYFEASFSNKLPDNGINSILQTIYEEKSMYLPESVMLEVTNQCNFNCQFCYIHTCNRDLNHLRFSVIHRDLQYLVDNGLLHCVITGGECLLNPDFIKIYRFLKTNGVLVTVLSNLSLLTNEHIEVFRELPPYKVDVSVYGYSNEEFWNTTSQRHVNVQTIFTNILRLKNEGIRVTCKTPENIITENEIPKIREWCIMHDVEYYTSPEIFENYNGQSMDHFISNPKSIDVERVESITEKYGANVKQFGRKMCFDCKGGQYGLFVSYDYKVRPCLPFYSIEEANFAITSEGIHSSLESMKMLIQRYSGTPLKYCNGCDAVNLCKECVITQLKIPEDQLANHLIQKCKHNISLLDIVKD